MPRILRSVAAWLIAAGASQLAFAAAPTPTPTPTLRIETGGDEWHMTRDAFGNELHQRMSVKIEKGRLSGWIFEGGKRVSFSGTSDAAGNVRFEMKDDDEKVTFTGKLTSGATPGASEMSGTSVTSGPDEWGESPPKSWRARRVVSEKDRPASPRTLDFEPTEFHRVFSPSIPPVMRIWPGDVVRTRTVDAAGVDASGKTRVLGGNPQTGPFYVEGAMPGDVIAVHLSRVRLNRSNAISDDGLVDRAITSGYAADHKDNDFSNVVWNLDREKGLASPAKPTERLKHLSVPVRPMLGCVGVAPGFGRAEVQTGDSGRIGGNMDFAEIREGATVYLGVSQPGALLYMGDGHALQGDGELNGNALETSMDVEFSVDLLREKRISGPRVENDEYLMAMGLSGSLDDAFREAGSALAGWLQQDYGLTGKETAILLGAVIEYQISEVADRNVGIVAKVKKKYLPAKAAPAK
jgi:acetamidase/formamidase